MSVEAWRGANSLAAIHAMRRPRAFVTSGLLLDDGVIDPRETRAVLAFVLATCREADARALRPVQYGVARP